MVGSVVTAVSKVAAMVEVYMVGEEAVAATGGGLVAAVDAVEVEQVA